jgi:hypothetical protein
MGRKLGGLALLTAVAATAMLAAAAPASAGGGATFVSGSQRPTADPNEYVNSGSLVGNWSTTSFVVKSESSSGNVYTLVGTGTETFVGCLDTNRSGVCDRREPTGSIDFTFVFRGTYDSTSFAQLSGGCIHPVVGGTGDFSHPRGVIAYRDDVSSGISYYVGYLSY